MSFLDVLAVAGDGFSTQEYNSADAAATFAGLGVFLVVGLLVYLIVGFLLYKVFQKAGRPGWAAFVPFYNMWVLFEISGKPGWWALLVIPSFIPIIGLLFSIALMVLSLLASLELAKRFGKDQVFAIFALWLFSIIGYAILAFDDSKYKVAGVASPSPTNNPGAAPPQTPPKLT